MNFGKFFFKQMYFGFILAHPTKGIKRLVYYANKTRTLSFQYGGIVSAKQSITTHISANYLPTCLQDLR